MIKVLVSGAGGRMGISNIQAVKDAPDMVLSGALEFPGSPAVGKDAGDISGTGHAGVTIVGDIKNLAEKADVMIDFSSPQALAAHAEYAVASRTALVVGTTGITDLSVLEKASKSIPVIWAPNYSVGVNLLARLCTIAGAVLKQGFDAEIIEAHHRMKKDAPSGTAIKLLNVLKKVYETEDVVYGREGMPGERPAQEIGVHAVRGGDIVGDHTVLFAGIGERLELTHKASSRMTFSLGALRAARYILQHPQGLFTMEDVLGF